MDPFTVPVALDNQPSQPHSPPQQQPSVAAASPTAPAAPPTLNHPPPYAEMIYAAITALKKKNGSSKIAIGKHIEQSYSNLPANHSTLLTQHLQRLKNTGHLLMVKKSYKLPRCDAPVPETNNNNNQDNAVNISSSAHGSKTSRGPGRPPKNLNAVKAQPVSVPVGLVDQTPHLTPAKRGRGRQISGPPVGLGGRADAAVPKLKRRTKRPVGRPRKVQVQAQPISDAEGQANAAVPKSQVQAQAQPILIVPKSKRLTRRPVGRPRKVQVQAQPISDAEGEANAAVPKSQVQAQAQPILIVPKSKRLTRRPVGRPRKVQVQAQPISDAVGEANAAVPKSQVQAQAQPILTVPKSKRRTRRPVGRPRKVQVQAQPISDAVGEANAAVPKSQVQAQAQPILTVPKSKRRTRRPVGRPRKVQVQAQPISDAVGEANAAVPKSQVQAQAQPILTVPKLKRRTRRPVGRPRKDEVVSQRESSENDVRCLRGELQQVRDDRDRQELRVQALTAELDLKERQLTAANEKSTALAAELDLKDEKLKMFEREPLECEVHDGVSEIAQNPVLWPSGGQLTFDWIRGLMSIFNWSSKNIPPHRFPSVFPLSVFDNLVSIASKILHKEPNCVKIDGLHHDSTVVVVGDIHGQLHDLLFLLQDAGFPSEARFFIFNGDYVDRGAWGLETFLLLLAWKVFLPHRVCLLRGNHETKYCTSVYGFKKEVLSKYGDEGMYAYQKCLNCFKELPLASIIAGKVYTAHGGLFRSIPVTHSKRSKGKKKCNISLSSEASSLSIGTLEQLFKARRSVLDPPGEGSNLIPSDVLWSDPSSNKKSGLSLNEDRCIGLLWGPDCTENFLKNSNLKLIIRSHEGPDARDKRPDMEGMDNGFTIDHCVASGKLITLFSAPDYPQFQATEDRYNNKGAYVVLKSPNFDEPEFHIFKAVTPRPKANPFYDFENVIDSDEEIDLTSMAIS